MTESDETQIELVVTNTRGVCPEKDGYAEKNLIPTFKYGGGSVLLFATKCQGNIVDSMKNLAASGRRSQLGCGWIF